MPDDFDISESIKCYNENRMEEYLEFLETDDKRLEAETNLNLAGLYFQELSSAIKTEICDVNEVQDLSFLVQRNK